MTHRIWSLFILVILVIFFSKNLRCYITLESGLGFKRFIWKRRALLKRQTKRTCRTLRARPFASSTFPHRIWSAVSSCSTYWRLSEAARPDSWRPFRSAAGRECPASAPRDSQRTRTRRPDIPALPCTILGTRTTINFSRCNKWCRGNRSRWASRTRS